MYNCTRNDATGFSPFFFLFDRERGLPIDQIFGLCHQSKTTSYPKYVTEWGTVMKDAQEIVKWRTENQLRTRGERDRKKVRSSSLNPGDRVLIRNLSERGGPGKLRAYWEEKIHIVVERKGEDSPVCAVKPEGKEGKVRVLHRNLLLPSHFLEKPSTNTENKSNNRNRKKRCGRTPRIRRYQGNDFYCCYYLEFRLVSLQQLYYFLLFNILQIISAINFLSSVISNNTIVLVNALWIRVSGTFLKWKKIKKMCLKFCY